METIESLIPKWAEDLRRRNLSPRTVNEYTGRMTEFLACLKPLVSDDPLPRHLTRQRIEAAHRVWSRGHCANAKNQCLIRVHIFTEWLIEKGLLRYNHVREIKRCKVPKTLPKSITHSQLQALLTLRENPTYYDVLYHAIAVTLAFTGLRVSEVIGLRLSDVLISDTEGESRLFVMGKGSKERLIPLNQTLLATLKAWLQWRAPAGERFFCRAQGQPVSRSAIWNHLTDKARQCGICERLGPHVLRHTFATHLVDKDVNLYTIKELLGHASVKTTEVYLSSSAAAKQKAVATLG